MPRRWAIVAQGFVPFWGNGVSTSSADRISDLQCILLIKLGIVYDFYPIIHVKLRTIFILTKSNSKSLCLLHPVQSRAYELSFVRLEQVEMLTVEDFTEFMNDKKQINDEQEKGAGKKIEISEQCPCGLFGDLLYI